MDSDEVTTHQSEDSRGIDQADTTDGSQLISPGGGTVLFRLPDWYRQRTPGTPPTPEEIEHLKAAFMPMVKAINQQKAEAPVREAILAALPGWMFEKLQTNAGITPQDKVALRAHFAMHYPELLARLDPVAVIGGWRYACWHQRNRGRLAPPLPPRSARAIELDGGLDQSEST